MAELDRKMEAVRDIKYILRKNRTGFALHPLQNLAFNNQTSFPFPNPAWQMVFSSSGQTDRQMITL